MDQGFGALDWTIVALYFVLLAVMGWAFQSHKSADTKDYFLGGNSMSFWLVAVSVLATTQSAATFLGGPDQGYRGNYSYLAANIGSMLAALIVARVFIPRFYAIKATTVYELLERRYDQKAMLSAGAMYLVGRVFAGGSRLYLAAIAVAMMLYGNIAPANIVSASLILMTLGFLVTFFGGIRSVIWSDLIQFMVYSLSAIAVLVFLWLHIPASGADIIKGLANTPDGQNKLLLFDLRLNFNEPYTILSIVTGLTLLMIGNYGLDQDTTQRLLTCKDSRKGGIALVLAVLMAMPLVWVFLTIGQLLHVFYDRPDLMGMSSAAVAGQEFNGERVTIFMYYILDQMPAGLKGLVASGVIAAAISTINSSLNSMSSVLVQDFYRPWRNRRGGVEEHHYVMAGRVSMGLVGLILFAMSVLCYYWQRYTDMPLIDFALSVMVFAYSGLLGVYFTVVFTKRGSSRSVIVALAAGFIVTLLQQSYVVDALTLPTSWKSLAFSWQLCIGTAVSFAVCAAVGQHRRPVIDAISSETSRAYSSSRAPTTPQS